MAWNTHCGITKLSWIRQQQGKLKAQARAAPRQFVAPESHFLWGRRYLLSIAEVDAEPRVVLEHRQLSLQVRSGSSVVKRAEVMHDGHKAQLHAIVAALITKWEAKPEVRAAAYFLQRMKTKRGSCSPHNFHSRLNTELAKKPKDLLEYVVMHEMVHLVKPSHNERFVTLLDRHSPQWRQ